MSDFSERFSRFLDRAEQDMAENFTLRRDPLIEGRWVAMDAVFNVSGEKKPFGLIPTGIVTHCFERCLFIPVETLDETALSEMLTYIGAVHDAQVQPGPEHEFSLFSLVLATSKADKRLLKSLRKFQKEVSYKKPQTGFSSVRVAVVDLSSGSISTNRLGSALGDRLKKTVKTL